MNFVHEPPEGIIRLSARVWTTVGCTVMAIGSFAVSLTASVRPDTAAAAAVFPPWWRPGEIFAAAAANGRVVQLGASAAIVLVRSDQPGLPARLRAAGALIVLDPRVAGGCASSKQVPNG